MWKLCNTLLNNSRIKNSNKILKYYKLNENESDTLISDAKKETGSYKYIGAMVGAEQGGD